MSRAREKDNSSIYAVKLPSNGELLYMRSENWGPQWRGQQQQGYSLIVGWQDARMQTKM
jgi:hypothetical protein